MYIASPGRPLPTLFKLRSFGEKWLTQGGHIFYIGLYNEKNEIIFLSENKWPIVLIFGT